MAGVKFTRESAARVAKATRAYEGSQQQSNPAARGNIAFAPWDTLLVGKTDAAHNKSASGTVSIWSGTTSAGLSDTGDNVTAYNRMGNIGSGKFVYVWTFPWGYEITAAEC
jgi:hypothetical protein